VRLSSVPVRSAVGIPLGLATLSIVALAAFGLDLGRAALWDPGEGRYAQTVREMMTSGRWLVPTLNGAPYLDKPPAFFWLVAASFKLFGMHEWAARLPSALAALGTLAATVRFAWWRLGPATAIGAGVVLATAGQFVVLGRSVRMDMALTMLLTLALFRAYALWKGDDTDHTWPVYVLLALGLLIKGPIAVLLPVLIMSALTIVTGEYDRLARLRPGPGVILAVLVACIWYVPAAIWSPEYLGTFVWQQNVGRFLGASTGHPKPSWYFLWVLPVTFLPWALFLPGALRHTIRRARRWHDLDLFLLCWLTLTVGFFSASSAKLATYVLPVFPPLALLVARYVARAGAAGEVTRRRAFRFAGWIWAILAGTVAIGAPLAAAVALPDYAGQATASLLLLPIVGSAILAFRRGNWLAAPVAIAIGSLALQTLFYRVAAPVVDDFASLRRPAQLAQALPDDTVMFVYKTRGHSFAFYDGRRLTRERSPDATAARLNAPAPAAVLTKVKYLDKLRGHLTRPACIWWRGASGRVLLTNVPSDTIPDAHSLVPAGWDLSTDQPPC